MASAERIETRNGDRERGSVLVSALALTVILAAIAILTIQIVLDTAYLHRQEKHLVEQDAALRSGFALALRTVATGTEPIQFGEGFVVQTNTGALEARFFSPLGRVDINAAPQSVLQVLLTAAGASEPDTLSAAIIDWRDPDDLRSNNGAEAREYAAAGLPAPGNRFFRHEDELKFVLGATDELVFCLRSHITVSTWEETPDARFAPSWLIGALNLDPGGEARQAAPPVSFGSGDLLGLELRWVEDNLAGRGVSVLVRFTGDPADPYWIQAWDKLGAANPACPGEVSA
tara:strand:- start:248131 stop:248994 length:864 start_codon:yes stop_codon:yes gene_type:complete